MLDLGVALEAESGVVLREGGLVLAEKIECPALCEARLCVARLLPLERTEVPTQDRTDRRYEMPYLKGQRAHRVHEGGCAVHSARASLKRARYKALAMRA